MAITALDREGVDAVCRSLMAPWAIERVERVWRRRRGGGDRRGGKECGGEVAVMPLSVGLRLFEMFVLRRIR